jgi:non-specific serine/threonine protein kinase/serine/threonine-protein kinase
MQAERWKEIEHLCGEALEREEGQRAEFLQSACAGDEPLLREVQSLLAHQKQAEHFIETPALEQAAKALADGERDSHHSGATPRLIGRMISHYRIAERLGFGGMGEVYRAVRADDQYQKLVALKIVKTDCDTQFVLERFKNERQILAGLEHPNIARLIDGGTTDDGLPYFVMELVEGQPIDQYCESHRLSTAGRLKLFRSVCSAVHYAHQHLVVHRDIKPSNIMVTSEGVPKLLDFGIAKIMDAGQLPQAIEPTVTAMRVMTPEYASPEQIRGEAITTASDVYSLGVLLYYILTGHLPYRLTTRSPHEVARAICEIEPEKPSAAVLRVEEVPGADGKLVRLTPETVSSTREGQPERLRRRLGGDLDQIVLQAMRKEKDRRYTSVEQLSEDIGRHLEGQPVLARKGTLSYHAAKFVKRHKAGVIAAALALLTLIAGMAAIVRESRLERAQRARAERRFNDVRKLANSLFTVHDAIANLPGSVAARKMIVGLSLNYLDSLANEASGDASLQRELAGAYAAIADIQGRAGTENLGDTKGALASYQKSADITQAVLAGSHSDQDKHDLASLYIRIGHTLTNTGDNLGAMKYDHMAFDIYTELTQKNPANLHFRNMLAIANLNLGQHQDFLGELQASLESYEKAAVIYEDLFKSGDPKVAHSAQYNLGFTYLLQENTWQDLNNFSKALECGEKSLEIRKLISERNPKNVRGQLDLADSYVALGDTLRKQAAPERAAADYRQGQAIAESVSASDPNDQRAREELVDVYCGLGESFRRQGNLLPAIDLGNSAVKIATELVAADPVNAHSKAQLAQAYFLLGDAYQAKGIEAGRQHQPQSSELKEGLSSYQRGLEIYTGLQQARSLPYSDSAELSRVQSEIVKCEATLGKTQNPVAAETK